MVIIEEPPPSASQPPPPLTEEDKSALFRPVVIEARRRKLYGSVSLWQPVPMLFYSAAAIFGIGLAVTFLAIGKYSRKESVVGWIVPSGGLSQVYATRGGVLSAALVKQGDIVAAGQEIARFSIDVAGANGAVAPLQRAQANARIAELGVQASAAQNRYSAEDSRLLGQARGMNAKYTQDNARLLDNIKAINTEAAQMGISRDMAQQNLIIETRTLSRMKEAGGAGAMSALEIDRQSQAVISARAQAQELNRQIESRRANASDLERQRASLRAEYLTATNDIQKQRALISPTQANEASQIRAAKSQLESGLTELSVSDGYVVRAPISGKVASLNLRVGEAAANAPFAAIVPINSVMEAELLVPTRASGFVKNGMSVRVMVDAFPYQKFGIIKAEINEITRAAFRPGELNAPVDFKEPVYRVRANLSGGGLKTYGVPTDLQSGMTIRADIITDTRSFLAWILDPLFAAQAKWEN